MFWFHFKFIYFLTFTLTIVDSFKQAWIDESKDSIQRNIHGKCKQTIAPNLNIKPKENEFFISFHLPSIEEYQNFTKIPHTLTKISLDIHHPSVNNKLTKEEAQEGSWPHIEEHPHQNKSQCVKIVRFLHERGIVDLYQGFKDVKRTAYLVRSKNAIIHPAGYVGIECGMFQGREGCESRFTKKAQRWWENCANYFKTHNIPWSHFWDLDSPHSYQDPNFIKSCNLEHKVPKKYNKVFVATALWDDNFAHFLLDGIGRIARHLEFLRKNPDIKVLIRHFHDDPKHVIAGLKMKLRLFNMLGISADRVVYGPVLADEVFIPRALTCGYALFNPLEIRLLAQEILEGARKEAARYWLRNNLDPETGRPLDNKSNKKYLIIQQRDKNAKNPGRGWSNETAQSVVDAFRKRFPNHEVLRLSSITQATRDYCAACEIVQYSQAEIIVGMHGAGLINMIFMPSQGLVVEISNDFNGLTYPFCSYIGPQSSLAGHHHYMYSFETYAHQRLDPQVLAEESLSFYQEMQLKPTKKYPMVKDWQFYGR